MSEPRSSTGRAAAWLLLLVLCAGCGLDDGARIRDRDGAGVQPSSASDDG